MTETEIVTSSALAQITSAEIDLQIATAKQYPRSIEKSLQRARDLACSNEQTAIECMYAIRRAGKTIEGPSARFAEILSYVWGNVRHGARVVNEEPAFITAQGIVHDLETNVAVTVEVKRRIVDSQGVRYNADMIQVTGNAAASIALRNAVLKAIPRALWWSIYEAARQTAIGDVKTLASRRAHALGVLARMGAPAEVVYARLGVAGESEITSEHLAQLHGFASAIKEGEAVEAVFALDAAEAPPTGASAPKKGADRAKDRLKKSAAKAATAAPDAEWLDKAGLGDAEPVSEK